MNDKEKIIAARRALQMGWRHKNKDRLREYGKNWRKANPDKVKEYQDRYYLKVAEKMGI